MLAAALLQGLILLNAARVFNNLVALDRRQFPPARAKDGGQIGGRAVAR